MRKKRALTPKSRPEKIDQVMKVYVETGFNVNGTSKKTGVARKTIARWAEMKGITPVTASKSIAINANAEPIEDIELRKKRKAMLLQEAILEKMADMLPNMKPRTLDIDILGRVYKAVGEVGNAQSGDAAPPKAAMTFLQIVNNAIKIKKYGNQGDQATGDSPQSAG